MKKAKTVFDESLAVPEEKYQKFIEKKRLEIVNFHLQNNNFYKKLVGENGFTAWENLPILNKINLQIPLQERLSVGFKKNIYINKTSGSSGTPFIFAKDKFCHALTWYSNIYRFGWFNINFNKSLQARFYGIPLDKFGYYKERIKDFLAKRFRFSVFDLSDEKLEQVLEKFKTKKFDYINGYTNSVVLFAKFLQQKNIILKEVCPNLKACFVTSEMLFETDKKIMEKHFGVPIINEYGASELDLIAFENPENEWQVNSETLFVEILDENNQVLPFGQEGKIVITSLYNKAHPFIRYEIGDIGVLDEKSTWKKPILKKLVGRTNDVALLPSGKKAVGLTFYYVTKSIIEDNGNVKEFVIKQTKTDSFEIEYVSETELSSTQIKKIEAAICLYLEPFLNFVFIRKPFLNRSKSGKLKQFTSEI